MNALAREPTEQFAQLRLLVSILGGGAHSKWWRTEFLTVAGLRFLDRLYPRTSKAAAIGATGVAARELHDSSIGRGGVYHLFRLPKALEGHLHVLAETGYYDQVVDDLEPILENREALLTKFEGLATEMPKAEPGPQRIGSLREFRSSGLSGKWAGAYMQAFRNDYRVFPYVEVEAGSRSNP